MLEFSLSAEFKVTSKTTPPPKSNFNHHSRFTTVSVKHYCSRHIWWKHFHFAEKGLETCCAVIFWDRTDRRLVQLQEMYPLLKTFFVPLIIFVFVFVQTFGYRVILGIFTSFRNTVVIDISGNRCTGNGWKF